MINKIKNNAFAKNSLILFVGTMLASVLNYAFHLIVGRMVDVEVYGEVQSLTSLINIISVPAMTITMIATKYSAGFKADNDAFGCKKVMEYMSRKVTKFGLPVLIVAFAITPFLSDFLNIRGNFPLILIWLLMLSSFYLAINNGVLAGWQKFDSVSWVGFLGAFLKLFAGILLVKIGFGLNGVIGSFVIGMLASYVASIIMLRFIVSAKIDHEKGVFEEMDFGSIKQYAMPAFFGNLAINILGNIDMVMAKHNLDSIEAGQYGALTIVSKIIFFATGVIATVLFSMSAEDSHKKNDSMKIFANAAYLMMFVSLVSIAVYFVIPNFILGMLFGDKYSDVSHYLGWFAILVTLFSFVNLIFQYLLSIHKTKVVYEFLVVSVFLSVAVLFFGKDFYDILLIASVSQIIAIFVGFRYLFEKNLALNNKEK